MTVKITKVASCTPIETQRATLAQFNAPNDATHNATNSLKALAGKVLERNTQRNQSATNHEKPCNFDPEKQAEKLHESCAVIPVIPETIKSKLAELAEPFEYENAVIEVKPALIKCHDCLHFKCFNAHGNGAGHCLVGGDYGLWSETLHQCEKFDAAVVYETATITPGALIVTCYTPAGNPIKVEATSTEHAAWLIKMNPDRSNSHD
jgi:hypothetical protein